MTNDKIKIRILFRYGGILAVIVSERTPAQWFHVGDQYRVVELNDRRKVLVSWPIVNDSLLFPKTL